MGGNDTGGGKRGTSLGKKKRARSDLSRTWGRRRGQKRWPKLKRKDSEFFRFLAKWEEEVEKWNETPKKKKTIQ